jgi:predicted nuclease of predicted toxin-antitoxin system
MKFLADENVDKPVVERLRDGGHAVLYVVEMEPSISDDEAILRANQEMALLLTADNDFGELVFRQRRIVYGVVLIRLAGLSPQRKAAVVAIAIQEHADELAQNFTVITPGTVRIRKQRSW